MIEPPSIETVAEVLDRHWPAAPAKATAAERDRRRWLIEDAAKDVLERLDALGYFSAWEGEW